MLAVVSWGLPVAVAVWAVPVAVRGLGDHGYGVVSLVGAVSGYLALTQAGFGSAIIRFIAMFVAGGDGRAARQCLREVLVWFTGAGLLGGVAMWVLAPWLVTGLLHVPVAQAPQAIEAFRIGGATFALGAIASPLSLLPSAFLRYDLVAWLQSGIGSMSLAGPAIIVLLGYGLIPVMWFGAALNGVAAVLYGIVGLRLVRRVPSQGTGFAQHRRAFVGFVLAEAINEVWCLVQSSTNRMIVGIAGGGTNEVAFFTVSSTVADRTNGLLNAMARVLLPTVARLRLEEDREQIVALYERATRLLFLLNASITGAVVVFSAPLLGHWIAPRYATLAGPALALLILAQLVAAMSQAGGQVNLALGKPKINLAFSVINSIVNLATVYAFTVAWGITGTAGSILLAAFVMPTFVVYTNRKVLGIPSWPMFRDCYVRTAAVTTAVAVAAWFALRPLASTFLVTLALVAVTTAIGLALCAAIGVVTPEDRDSIRRALRRWMPARLSGGGSGGVPGAE